MGTSGEIKEPCAGKWWFITIGLCLLICIGGFILTLYLSQNLSFSQQVRMIVHQHYLAIVLVL